MTNLRALFLLMLLCVLTGATRARAQSADASLEIEGKTDAYYYLTNRVAVITNGVTVKYRNATNITVLTADRATVNQDTGEIDAAGAVRLQQGSQTWTGDTLHYNYLTKETTTDKFRTGEAPYYASGSGLTGNSAGTNSIYHGTNVLITTDDYFRPFEKVRAKRFTIVPGKYVEAHDATLYLGEVPVFYFPYFRHKLEQNPNHFSFLPGYRSLYGPYLLSSYVWTYNEHLNGEIHADYREKRGGGFGPDVNYNFGKWGEGNFRYYYAHDEDPGTDPFIGTPIPRDRQRTLFTYLATPATNLTIQSQVAYQTDPYIVRDFFESEYNKNIQPATFLDANKFWQNWSLDALADTRVNPFWETVERLPDVRLNGFRQEIGNTPLFYESQSSIGYYRRLFSDTNGVAFNPMDFSGTRADTFHQITLPQNYFGWLNFTPRVGGRYTYYDTTTGPSAVTTNQSRGVFNTGAEISFTASQLWPDVKNDFLDVNGLRHIMTPSLNYVYVPRPNVTPNQLPQFDYQLTNNLSMLPIDFPNYNDVDSINSQNTIRYGLNNRLQTKRDGQIEDLVNWDVYMDWNLRPRTDETTFSDIFSDFTLKPRSWLSFNSLTRYSIADGQFNLAAHSFTIQPNNVWNWTIGHFYLRDGPLFGQGDNLYTSVFFYRLNENWGTRIAHYFSASTGELQEQDYSIYRDMRSFTAALTFRELNNLSNGKDYAVAVSFSFKSFPRFALGGDTIRAANLVGY